MPAKVLISIVVLAALVAAGLWVSRDSAVLRGLLPAGLAPAPPAAPAANGARKCVGGERVVYTDGACPAGTQARAMDGGSLSVLPAAPAAARAQAPASAQTPLRRLAGEGGAPDQNERRVDQALQR